jgi:aldehyde:ferredoxin oxidoreductase
VFHAEREAGKMTAYLENRAFGRIGDRDKLERKMERAKRYYYTLMGWDQNGVPTPERVDELYIWD